LEANGVIGRVNILFLKIRILQIQLPLVMDIRSTIFLLLFLPMTVSSQLVVQNPTTLTPDLIVQNWLVGPGVTASNISFNGGSGTIWREQIGSFDASNAILAFGSGVLVATGDVQVAVGPNDQSAASAGGQNIPPSPGLFCDTDLQLMTSGTSISSANDCAVLEFDFVPTGDTVYLPYIFGSEEYPEFAPPIAIASINDAMLILLSGPGISGAYSNGATNIAMIPGTNQDVSVSTINPLLNTMYYVPNGDGFTAPFDSLPGYIQFDGMTVPLVAKHAVQSGQTYHMKIAIADANDNAFDSGLFLLANALSTSPLSTGQYPPLDLGDKNIIMNAEQGMFSISDQDDRYEAFMVDVVGRTIPVTRQGAGNNWGFPQGLSSGVYNVMLVGASASKSQRFFIAGK
jgi:hypothetical protein